ncbi:MAG TPA: DUF4268 domain-containing protein [Chitinophagaceae bacterium]|nr:DUF4268 domain-containing protein [Chitinophagaceae bacterium]
MYSKQEASQLRKKFWTQFGQYMRPLPCSKGEPINWLNYKTGIRHLYFRMDTDNKQATIAIELRHKDPLLQQYYFEKFRELKKIFQQTITEEWQWELHGSDEDGKLVSRISSTLKDVNIYYTNDWPAIISFLKPRMLALDNFWTLVKEGFERLFS